MTVKVPVVTPLSFLTTVPKQWVKRELLPFLADLRLAIALLLTIALFSISGTVIEQGQSLAFYQKNYPEAPALFGFLTWKVLLFVGLDHVYRTWWFLGLLVLFGTSLATCTFKRQLPALKWFNRSQKLYTRSQQFHKFSLSAEFDHTALPSILPLLTQSRYRIFQEGDSVYARKGLIGRIGPIVVHASMLLILAGGIIGALTGFIAQEMIPSGTTFQVKNVTDAGPYAGSQVPKDWSVRVDRFWIDYRDTGAIDQFYSDMTVLDQSGQEVKHKIIHVNEPLRYKGVTLYQASWAIAAAKVRINRSPVFQLPMAELKTIGQGQIWGTWVPTKPDLSAGVSLVAKDLQGMVLIYDMQGKLVTTIRKGMSAEVNGVTLYVDDLIGSTGLQIKADPGIPLVYAGFGLLMLGVIMSYVSHSQIWVLQKDGKLYVGGTTNRAQVSFEREMLRLFDQLAESGKVTA
jgi:cytochrome c biogenesis protein